MNIKNFWLFMNSTSNKKKCTLQRLTGMTIWNDSMTKPHVRPIVRGKAKADVELALGWNKWLCY